jgi:uncharacterized protein
VAPRRLKIAAVVAALLLVAYGAICFRYADTLSRVKRHPIEKPPTLVAQTHEDVTFTSLDGLVLKGWWFTAPRFRDRAVVFVHGKDQDRIDSSFQPAPMARFLLDDGYDALLFDLRGHGESEGLRWGLGAGESLDVAAAVELAAQKAKIPRSRVAVIGESMGAGSAALALAKVPDVGPMVLDSVYTTAATVVDEIGPRESGLPAFFTPGMVFMARAFFGLAIDQVRPIDQVRAHPERAFLFIQCENDTTVAEHHGLEMKAASADPETQLWLVPGCEHVKAFTTHPTEWQARVTGFLDGQLGP